MPTVNDNLICWNDDARWVRQGDDWSDSWGGADAQWYGAIYPRVKDFLPVKSILELAPGFGRWTQFLKEHCEQLKIVDLSHKCIEACQKRFSADTHIGYYVNDGRSLSMIPDESMDFVFSFDSFVHVEADVIQAYLKELRRILAPDGVGFIHHSNIGAYPRWVKLLQLLPSKLKTLLMGARILARDGWRAYSMTAEKFEAICQQEGLQCISQETVNWGGKRLTDCFSLFTLKSSKWARPNQIIRNPNFMNEADAIRRAAAECRLDS